MTRLTPLTPAQLSEAQRQVYEAITGGKRASGPRLFPVTAADGSLHGPFNAMLVSPALGQSLQRVGEILRFESTLSASVRELVVLMISREWRCEYEWHAHVAVARHNGMPQPTIDQLHAGELPEGLDQEQTAAYHLCAGLLRDRAVSDEVYRAASEVFDERGLVELVFLFGYYTALAVSLNTFATPLPPGVEPAFSAHQ